MNDRSRSRPVRTYLSRLTLAAFLASIPGGPVQAQVVLRAATAAGSEAGAAAAVRPGFAATGLTTIAPLAAISAPSAAPSVLASGPLAAPLAAPAARLAAPALATLPAAQNHGAPSAAVTAAPVPVAAAETAAPDARAALSAAATADGEKAPLAAAGTFDGTRAKTGDDDGAPRGGSGSGSGPLVPSGLPREAPVMALNGVFFPGVQKMLLTVGDSSRALVEHALANGGWMVAATLGKETEEGHNRVATLVRLTASNKPAKGERETVNMEVLRVVKILSYSETDDGVSLAKIQYTQSPTVETATFGLSRIVKQALGEYAPSDPKLTDTKVKSILEEVNPGILANRIAQEFPFTVETKVRLMGIVSDADRLRAAFLEMMNHFHAATVKAAAKVAAAPSIDTLEGLKAKMAAIGMPASVQAVAVSEFEKYSKMNPKDSEAQKMRTYLEWITGVPWGQRTTDTFDIVKARKALDRDHAGMEQVKERVLEFLAVRKKTGSVKGAIICFVGPPGVGKTSIAKDIAEALGRRFARLSLGGVSDTAELRGHGRTYVGSQPGALIRQMKDAGSINPVFLLDEVDKLGRQGNHGDPTAALLEILDPEQNNTFRDHYLDVPYDLSEALFIVTANDLSSIPEPLRDRMEIIEFTGYTPIEKVAIAQKHVIPEMQAKSGLKPEDAALTPEAVRAIVDGYTRESGVRKLRQVIEKLMRKVSAWTETRGEKTPGRIEAADVEKYLGAAPYSARRVAQNGVGVATGLAVNDFGGSAINIEVTHEPGTGQVKLRKQFGDDIDDSARTAYKFVKKNAEKYGVKDIDFQKVDIDLNFTPAGKIDGPSAGSLMATAIISAFTGRPVKSGVAMTGEISTRGDVLPIGGLAQKVMAAHRMGYTTVIYPADNEKDVAGIPEEVRKAVKLVPAKTFDDVFAEAFEAVAP